MERDRLDNMDWTEGHSDCRAGREEKSKLVAERSRETAEKTGTTEVEAGIGLKGRERLSATMFVERDGLSVWRTTAERNGTGLG